jgi:hypothetical protein
MLRLLRIFQYRQYTLRQPEHYSSNRTYPIQHSTGGLWLLLAERGVRTADVPLFDEEDSLEVEHLLNPTGKTPARFNE